MDDWIVEDLFPVEEQFTLRNNAVSFPIIRNPLHRKQNLTVIRSVTLSSAHDDGTNAMVESRDPFVGVNAIASSENQFSPVVNYYNQQKENLTRVPTSTVGSIASNNSSSNVMEEARVPFPAMNASAISEDGLSPTISLHKQKEESLIRVPMSTVSSITFNNNTDAMVKARCPSVRTYAISVKQFLPILSFPEQQEESITRVPSSTVSSIASNNNSDAIEVDKDPVVGQYASVISKEQFLPIPSFPGPQEGSLTASPTSTMGSINPNNSSDAMVEEQFPPNPRFPEQQKESLTTVSTSTEISVAPNNSSDATMPPTSPLVTTATPAISEEQLSPTIILHEQQEDILTIDPTSTVSSVASNNSSDAIMEFNNAVVKMNVSAISEEQYSPTTSFDEQQDESSTSSVASDTGRLLKHTKPFVETNTIPFSEGASFPQQLPSLTKAIFHLMMTEATKQVPEFRNSDLRHPIEFLNSLENHFLMFDVPEWAKLNMVRKAMIGEASYWMANLSNKWTCYNDFRCDFLLDYWPQEKQNRIRLDIKRTKYCNRTHGSLKEFFEKRVFELQSFIPPIPEKDIACLVMSGLPSPQLLLWNRMDDHTLSSARSFIRNQDSSQINRSEPTSRRKKRIRSRSPPRRRNSGRDRRTPLRKQKASTLRGRSLSR